jgi:hypothetical protein
LAVRIAEVAPPNRFEALQVELPQALQLRGRRTLCERANHARLGDERTNFLRVKLTWRLPEDFACDRPAGLNRTKRASVGELE